MNTSRKILANLGCRVYHARHNRDLRRKYINTVNESLYHEAVGKWMALHNAFQEAKRIYFENIGEKT